jgi:O-antigen ligase
MTIADVTTAPPRWGTRHGTARSPRLGQDERAGARRLPLILAAAAVVMLPVTVPRGPGNLGPADLFIVMAVAAWLFSAAASGERLRFPYALGIGLLMAGGAIGGLAGPLPDAALLALVQDLLLLAWCLTLVNVCRTPEAAGVVLKTWVYSSAVWALALFVGLATGAAALTGKIPTEGSRTALTFGDPNLCANYFFISLAIIWATGRPRNGSLRVLVSVVMIAAMVTTGSNSGLVSLAVGLSGTFVFGTYRRSGLIPALAATACIVVVAAVGLSTISLHSLQRRAYTSGYAVLRDGIGRGQASVTERSRVLSESLKLYADGGPLGEGAVSTKPRMEAAMDPYPKEAHDDYFAALLERGIVGALGLVILISGLLVRTGSLLRRGAEPLGGVLRSPQALAAGVAGTMTTMAVYELLHVRHVWGLFAIVAVAAAWERR